MVNTRDNPIEKLTYYFEFCNFFWMLIKSTKGHIWAASSDRNKDAEKPTQSKQEQRNLMWFWVCVVNN